MTRRLLIGASALGVVALLVIGGYAWFQRVDEQFAHEIESAARDAAEGGRSFALTAAIQNDQWDAVFAFGPYVSRHRMETQIGGSSSRLPDVSTQYDGRQLVVFVRDGRPVFHVEMARCSPDFVRDQRMARGVERSDARFTLRKSGECLIATLELPDN